MTLHVSALAFQVGKIPENVITDRRKQYPPGNPAPQRQLTLVSQVPVSQVLALQTAGARPRQMPHLSRLHIQPEVMANFIAPAAVGKEQFATKTGIIGYPQAAGFARQLPQFDFPTRRLDSFAATGQYFGLYVSLSDSAQGAVMKTAHEIPAHENPPPGSICDYFARRPPGDDRFCSAVLGVELGGRRRQH